MSGQCDYALAELGGGIAAALNAVDCVASQVTSEAFGRLFAPGGSLGMVLTILLTLYVAFFAISLLLGRSNLSIRSLIPRMITLGLVLTFATSWVAYQSVVWNLAIGTPDYLATVLTGSAGSATQVFAQKLDVVFLAVQQASEGQQDISAFTPPGMMWIGALLLLLGTVGVLVTARIALALLVALGPIFVVMALFEGTRGLFTGWIKGVVMLALTPLLAVLGGSIMLELAVPVLAALTQFSGQIDAQAAMAFLLIGAVHAALMVMVLRVAGTMVAGWQVFGLVPAREASGPGNAAGPARPVEARSAPPPAAPAATTRARASAARRIEIASLGGGTVPANDGAATHRVRETRVFAASAAGGQAGPTGNPASRTRGIGNRFRSARPQVSEKV